MWKQSEAAVNQRDLPLDSCTSPRAQRHACRRHALHPLRRGRGGETGTAARAREQNNARVARSTSIAHHARVVSTNPRPRASVREREVGGAAWRNACCEVAFAKHGGETARNRGWESRGGVAVYCRCVRYGLLSSRYNSIAERKGKKKVNFTKLHVISSNYHKAIYLTLILSQNYIFKVKYRKTIGLVTKLSKKNYRFNINLVIKLGYLQLKYNISAKNSNPKICSLVIILLLDM